jgi:hypothetical protein
MYDLHEIIRAIDIIQDPGSNPQDRINAQSLCDQLNNASNIFDIASELFSNHYSIHVRYFGLHLIENHVKSSFPPLDHTEELQIFKDRLLRLVSPSFFNLSERILRAKLSEIIVQCLLRTWPQRWSTFFDNSFSFHHHFSPPPPLTH